MIEILAGVVLVAVSAVLVGVLASRGRFRGGVRGQGYLARARTVQDEVLTARRELLGPRHPDTLTAANNLATTMQAQGDLVGARTLHDKVHTARRELLGPRHPATLIAADNLAETIRRVGVGRQPG